MNNSEHKKLLILYDFSEPSENALQFAVDWASHANLGIHILNVQNFPVSDMVLIANFTQNYNVQLDAALTELEKLKSKINFEGELSYSAEFGEVAHSAKDFCEAHAVICVIMGIKTRSSFLVKWFGSNTTAVINSLTVPVLLIPTGHNFSISLNVAFASDKKSSESNYLHKLHILLGEYINNFLWIHFGSEKEKNLMPDIKVQELMSQYFPNTSHHVETTNEIQEALAEFSANHKVDILVMRTDHKNLLSRITTKSVSREYSYKTTIPLLIFTS